MDDICLICKISFSKSVGKDIVTVKSKGIKTIRSFSEKRNDGIAKSIRGKATVRLHSECRNTYTKRVKKSEKVIRPKTSLRSDAPKFNFHTCCFLCGVALTPWELRTARASRVSTLEAGRTFSTLADRRTDNWGLVVKGRIEAIQGNLFAADARYHQKCSVAFRDAARSCPAVTPLSPVGQRGGAKRPSSAGRRPDEAKSGKFVEICKYIEDNEECQFSIQEVLQQFHGLEAELYGDRYLRKLLEAKYAGIMHFADLPGNRTIFGFFGATWKTLNASWYAKRLTDGKAERLRIVDLAARIIRDDIRAMLFDCQDYPTPQAIEEGGRGMVPESLKLLLDIVIKTNRKTNPEKLDRLCLASAHGIMAATRPRSFVSPIQVGLAIDLHQRFGSRDLIETLNAVGACASYNEVVRFESAVVLSPFQPEIQLDAHVQFVFDNADVNINTLDGHGTFHCMGGIACITPSTAVSVEPKVTRKGLPGSAAERGVHGYLPIKPFKRTRACGLDAVVVKDLRRLQEPLISFLRAGEVKRVNLLWLAGFTSTQAPTPSWNGFFEMSFRHLTDGLEKSSIYPIPFVNLSPSNPTTIYTCLDFVADTCKKRNQASCVITFDQPLFQKAIEIVLQADQGTAFGGVNLIIRLGGFHTAMSYLGSIGFIMAGSGLSEALEQVYAKNTVPHMLSGKAYSRSVRGHLLMQAGFACFLLKELSSQKKSHLEELMKSIIAHPSQAAVLLADKSIVDIEPLLLAALRHSKVSRTGKLWAQYYEMVDILKDFIVADRLGDWGLHLETVRKMIPFFHAAGHLNYARSAHLYYQQMEDLELKMSPQEYQQFVDRGFFTISRSGGAWSGVSTDMVIEQNLMKFMKTKGAGITSGRGISASTLATMIRTLPLCSKIRDAVEKFTGTDTESSEQHKDLRTSRQERDKKDFSIFLEWLQAHSPLETLPSQLISVGTGVVGDSTVNCDKALENGERAIGLIAGKLFSEVTMSRKFKVVPLAAMGKSVKVGNNFVIPLNVSQIFHRMVLVLKDENLEESFKFELATRPASLFDDAFMRKGTKSTLAAAIESMVPCDEKVPSPATYVVDGGFLLRRVVWPRPATYAEIAMSYVNFVRTHYGRNVLVVFDGYASGPTTKDEEQQRRQSKPCPEIMFSEKTMCITPQMSFLTNGKNKERLIDLLRRKMTVSGIPVEQAPGDADRLIIDKALEEAKSERVNVVVVGNDTDLLAILIQKASPEQSLHLLMPGVAGKLNKVHHIQNILRVLGDASICILFIHVFLGCDHTSAIFRKGKIMGLKLIMKRADLRNIAIVFLQPNATPTEIAAAGEKFFLALYGMEKCENLNKARYLLYKRTIVRQPVTAKFDIATLPPTTDGAKCHSLRVYHQIQHCLGNDLPPMLWGWNLCGSSYVPIPSTRPPAPERLMNFIVCNCNVCEEECFCKNSGLSCSTMCGQCAGIGCANAGIRAEIESERDADDEEEARPGDQEEEDEEAVDDPSQK